MGGSGHIGLSGSRGCGAGLGGKCRGRIAHWFTGRSWWFLRGGRVGMSSKGGGGGLYTSGTTSGRPACVSRLGRCSISGSLLTMRL